jgi:DNA-binding HxlR family transcriptional regulator
MTVRSRLRRWLRVRVLVRERVLRIQKRSCGHDTISEIEAQGRTRAAKAVRGSTSGRPIMVALDVLGRRWTLRIIWELRDGPLGFRELQARCDAMSSSVLRARLVELVAEGLVEQGDDGYGLTRIGAQLRTAIDPLTRWAERWRAAQAPA